MTKSIYLRDDRALDFPVFEGAKEITHARVIACRYERWDAIGQLTNLLSLEVFEWLAPTFDALRPLRKLQQLRVHHLPHVTSLDALSSLMSLERLILETRPGWDGSKVTQVESLKPLRDLPLEEVNMFGVRPASRSVDDLLAIPSLKKARLSKFAAKEIRRINELIPNEYVQWKLAGGGVAAGGEGPGKPTT